MKKLKCVAGLCCLMLFGGVALAGAADGMKRMPAYGDSGSAGQNITDHKGADMKEFTDVFPRGGANTAYARYFVGNSYLNRLSTEGVAIANVTFEPGCRNNWHAHHASKGGGQILLCTAGRGWYQEWGKPARELHAGDVAHIPAGVKHWHGAARDSWFSHVALEAPGESCSNEWCEPVDDEQYGKLD